jgi:hypothetical protein
MQIQTSHSTLNLGLTVQALLAELEDSFPQFLPQPNDSINMIMYKSGQRSIVEWIESRISEEEI